jgi:hypothetical protein
MPSQFRVSPTTPRHGAWPAAAVALTAMSTLVAGCSPYRDPGFNPYATQTPHGRSVLETAEDAVAIPENALDNFDRRFENVMY